MRKWIFGTIFTAIGGYLLKFPARFFEDWVMGEIEGKIAENSQSILSFVIAWVLPFAVVFGAIWLGFWLKRLTEKPSIPATNIKAEQKPNQSKADDIATIVEELRSLSIFDGIPIDATTVLYQLREQLAVGISEYQVQVIERPILAQLALRKIVQLEQRRKASGPRQYDEGYWILTEFGKEVIRYLETNQQVLDTEGSQPLGDGIQPIIAEPEVSVNIDKSSVLNYGQQSKAIKYGQLSQQGQAIEVAFTVNVKNPPVNIADLQMYMGKQILKRFSHDIKGTQRTNKECYTARFEPLKPDMLKILKQKDRSPDKYQLFVVVDDKSWPSKQFPINYP